MTTETTLVIDEPREPRKPTAMPLVFFPDPKLLEVSQPVTFNPYETDPALGVGVWVHGLKETCDDLIATMQGNQGVGLSAIQVGLPIRVIVIAGKEEKDAPIVMVNPVYVTVGTKVPMNEGCLSFPSVFEDVERYHEVHAFWLDVDGKENSGVFHGVQAQVIQHEYEHLDGHLLIEHLPTHKRDKIRLKMKQRQRLTAKISKLMAKKNQSLQSLINAGFITGARARPGFRMGK